VDLRGATSKGREGKGEREGNAGGEGKGGDPRVYSIFNFSSE